MRGKKKKGDDDDERDSLFLFKEEEGTQGVVSLLLSLLPFSLSQAPAFEESE